jgi:hypothetical protein
MSAFVDNQHASVGKRAPIVSRALGSVRERVAHQAECSVLVVREAPWQQADKPEVADK